MIRKTVGLLALIAAGCAGPSKYTGREEVVGWEDELRQRAAFELGCTPEALTVVSLGGGMRGGGGTGESAGVTGCGKKAVYVMAGPGAWIANTAHSAQ